MGSFMILPGGRMLKPPTETDSSGSLPVLELEHCQLASDRSQLFEPSAYISNPGLNGENIAD
jgi:hypothetical protein